MIEISEQDLSRCADGDPGALHRIYDRFADRIYRTALHVMGQSADAEDVVQDLFLGLPAKISSFGGRSRVSTWLYRMTVNHCLNALAKRRRMPATSGGGDDLDEFGSDFASPLAIVEQRDAQARCRELLGRLTERDRAILVLREIEELSYREIADVLDVPAGTVMSRLARARQRFGEVVDRADRSQEVNR
ncbi:MAG: sigma-70 family RNA polymerase sigma factor [Planctomycetes bacterium]|nr:sigma-70 family RNA polymerase sigma factor [Planctomycetota bacterium]